MCGQECRRTFVFFIDQRIVKVTVESVVVGKDRQSSLVVDLKPPKT